MNFNNKYKLIIIISIVAIAIIAVILLEMEEGDLEETGIVRGTQIDNNAGNSSPVQEVEVIEQINDDNDGQGDEDEQGDDSSTGNVETFVIVTE